MEGKGSSSQKKKEGLNFLKSSANKDYLKAIIFLADSYYKGGILKVNESKALVYMKKAENLGSNKYNSKITKLTANLQGTISKASCVRYNKNDKKLSMKVAQCIERNFLEGNPIKYYLRAFDSGNDKALISALNFAIKKERRDAYLSIVQRIHIFYKNGSDTLKFENILIDKGYNYGDCGSEYDDFNFDEDITKNEEDNLDLGISEIESLEEDFEFESSENKNLEDEFEFSDSKDTNKFDGKKNITACVFAALTGDQKAAAEVAEWWKDGLNDMPVSKYMSQVMIKKAEAGGSIAAIEGILKNLEDDPREHFKKIKSYSQDSMLQDIIPKALQLEAKLIATRNHRDFADNMQDIIYVYEKVSWEKLSGVAETLIG